METILKTKKLTKVYGTKTAVDSVDMTIKKVKYMDLLAKSVRKNNFHENDFSAYKTN